MNPKNITEQDKFTLYPNPVQGNTAFLNMRLYFQGAVRIVQTYVNGQEMGLIHEKTYQAGLHNVFLELKGGPGLYLLRIKVGKRNHFVKCLKI
jgi:hypothetical protein